MVQKRVCILTSDNGWGLTLNAKLMKNALEQTQYFKVDVKPWNGVSAPRKHYDINIHDEIVASKMYNQAKINVLTPHQEWFPKQWVSSNRRFQAVLCKTKLAVDIFTKYHFKDVRYTGFTTDDNYDPTIERVPEFLHLAGNSQFKNTNAVIETWRNNPDLPMLHLFNAYADLTPKVKGLKNVDYHFGKVDRKVITDAQNRYVYHLQPSAAEGYGHVIWEGMAVGAVVITLAAAPMNETHNCLKTPAVVYGNHHLGTLYKPTDLISTVRHALTLKDLGKWSLLARGEFKSLNAQFNKGFYDTIKGFVK